MIPLRDNIPSRRFPVVTLALIAANVLAFIWELNQGRYLEHALLRFAVVPVRYTEPGFSSLFHTVEQSVPLFTSMFLHGGWVHLIGNMWTFWIFGDNVEDRLGHGKFLLFYLACGVVAALFHIFTNAHSVVPTIGASGAVAGVMGAYLILYPRAKVLTWLFVLVFYVPAWVMLGYWFVLQFLSGTATSIAPASQRGPGVAFWAHIGGFIAGIVLIKIFPERAQRRRYATW